MGVSFSSHAEWGTSISKDEMTGAKSAFATSEYVFPTKKMEFPYSNTKAWIGVGCDGKSEWAYVGFNNSPNLNKTETQDGYSSIKTRIKWNDKVENVKMTQDWGSKFLHFRDDKKIIRKLAASSNVLLELNWHSQGGTYFSFPLSGSSAALKEIRDFCSKK